METKEKQSKHTLETPRKFGGAQPGAGRPKGAISKLSAKDILESLENTLGIPFPVQLALNYQQAVYGDDPHLKAKYDQFLLNKIIADKVDITSNGQHLAPHLSFTSQELTEYSTIIDADVKSA